MKTMWYIIALIIVVVVVWAISARNSEAPTPSSQTPQTATVDWSGTYISRVSQNDSGATNDGTSAIDLTLAKNGNNYDITYDYTGMTQIKYKAVGVVNADGSISATFSEGISNNITKKKGDQVFTLKQGAAPGEIEMMEVMANSPIVLKKK